MPACAKCVKFSDIYYYNARDFTKCTKYIEKQRVYNKTFSLEEFRKVGKHKKVIISKVRQKRRKITKLRAALIKIKSKSIKLEDSLKH